MQKIKLKDGIEMPILGYGVYLVAPSISKTILM